MRIEQGYDRYDSLVSLLRKGVDAVPVDQAHQLQRWNIEQVIAAIDSVAESKDAWRTAVVEPGEFVGLTYKGHFLGSAHMLFSDGEAAISKLPGVVETRDVVFAKITAEPPVPTLSYNEFFGGPLETPEQKQYGRVAQALVFPDGSIMPSYTTIGVLDAQDALKLLAPDRAILAAHKKGDALRVGLFDAGIELEAKKPDLYGAAKTYAAPTSR